MREKLLATSRASGPARDEARQRATREAETRHEARPNGAEGPRCSADESTGPGGREARSETGVDPTSEWLRGSKSR
jgi:hypothetical protein